MADNTDFVNIQLHISQEQLDAIQSLFLEKEWDFEKCEISDDIEDTKDEDEDNDNPEPNNAIPMNQNAEECPHCYCKPCITDEQFRQLW